eukprot:3091990-Rhodomonas_salina.3
MQVTVSSQTRPSHADSQLSEHWHRLVSQSSRAPQPESDKVTSGAVQRLPSTSVRSTVTSSGPCLSRHSRRDLEVVGLRTRSVSLRPGLGFLGFNWTSLSAQSKIATVRAVTVTGRHRA